MIRLARSIEGKFKHNVYFPSRVLEMDLHVANILVEVSDGETIVRDFEILFLTVRVLPRHLESWQQSKR